VYTWGEKVTEKLWEIGFIEMRFEKDKDLKKICKNQRTLAKYDQIPIRNAQKFGFGLTVLS